jgi:protein involved in polysaccharide export with SLBB domain
MLATIRALILVFATSFVAPLQSTIGAQTAASNSPALAPHPYTLRAGDIVRLRIWREPDLSGDFPVDEFGRVNLPLVGTYRVANETRESLHEKLVAAFRASVQNLSMDVIFLRRIPVTGAVRTPGLYPVDPTMTVADAVALAGGSTREAERTTIALMRSGKVIRKELDPATPVSLLETNPGDQLYVPPATGYFERNPWALTTIVQSAVTLAVAILTISRR